MGLAGCRRCGKLFNSINNGKYCGECIRKLEELYGSVHEFMRDHGDDIFDVESLAEAMEINPVDVQALVELGYIERDMQTYSREKKGSRQKIAEAIDGELAKMRRNGITTYGGIIYARDSKNEDAMKVTRRKL